MTGQLSFAGEGFRLEPLERSQYPAQEAPPPTPPAPRRPQDLSPDSRKRKDTTRAWKNEATIAGEVLDAAEGALLVEQGRPASIEHYRRLADAYDRRARAWHLLAQTQGGHVGRAMQLASEGDVRQARAIRRRLGVQQ